jgi:hypothetical protein
MGSRAVLGAVVRRKIPSPRRESNPRTPIVQPVAREERKKVGLEVNKVNVKYLCLVTKTEDKITI